MEKVLNAPALPAGDHDSAPYWQGIRRHQFLVQRCADCGALRWPASPVCASCHSLQFNWIPASGRGTVVSWSVVHRPPNQSFADRVPFVVAFIALDEDPALLVIGNLTDIDFSSIKAGLPVRVTFQDIESSTLVEWRALPSAAQRPEAQLPARDTGGHSVD